MSLKVNASLNTVCVGVCVVNADSVDWSKVRVTHDHDNDNVVHIDWHDPPSPNGVILSYELELTRADIANV